MKAHEQHYSLRHSLHSRFNVVAFVVAVVVVVVVAVVVVVVVASASVIDSNIFQNSQNFWQKGNIRFRSSCPCLYLNLTANIDISKFSEHFKK